MKSIIEEILEYRSNELKAGRTPATIRLTDEQKTRLSQWIEQSAIVTVMHPTSNQASEICGMTIL